MENFHHKPNVYVGEVSINVFDLDRSLDFYKNMIGLKVLEKEGGKAVLTANGETPLLTLKQPVNVQRKTERTSGLYHFALLVPSRADLSVILRHLVDKQYPLGAADHYVSEALYLNDPDGNGIEIYRDRPSEEWNWHNGLVAMATVELDAQGILAESNAAWSGLPSETIMGHIHLHVSDLKKAEEFYTKGLGFQTVSYYPQAAFLSTGGYHHHIAINTWQGTGVPSQDPNSVGLNWYSLIFPDEAVRAAVMTRLEQLGTKVLKEDDDYITTDPSGNPIRLVL